MQYLPLMPHLSRARHGPIKPWPRTGREKRCCPYWTGAATGAVTSQSPFPWMIFAPWKSSIRWSKHSHQISLLLLCQETPPCRDTHHPLRNGIEWQGASIDLRYIGISSGTEITIIIVVDLKDQRPRLILKKKSSGMSTTSTTLFGNWNNSPLLVNICFEELPSVSYLTTWLSDDVSLFTFIDKLLCWQFNFSKPSTRLLHMMWAGEAQGWIMISMKHGSLIIYAATYQGW